MHYGPSQHLAWYELACHDGTQYPQEWRSDRALELAEAFETVRAYFGGFPIRVNSAYRTPAWNGMVGGADDSEHLEGRAIDSFPPFRWTVEEYHDGIVVLAKRRGIIRGIGLYRTFVHFDTRPGEELVMWNGTRLVPESPKEIAA